MLFSNENIFYSMDGLKYVAFSLHCVPKADEYLENIIIPHQMMRNKGCHYIVIMIKIFNSSLLTSSKLF